MNISEKRLQDGENRMFQMNVSEWMLRLKGRWTSFVDGVRSRSISVSGTSERSAIMERNE